MDYEKKFKKYVKSTLGTKLMIGTFAFGALIGVLVGFDLLLFFGIVALLFGGLQLILSAQLNKMIKKAQQRGQWEMVLSDFDRAKSILGDAVRVGERYIFSKKRNAFFAYEDIIWVYRFTQRYYLIPVSSSAMIGEIGGKIIQFCSLKSGEEKGNKQLAELVGAIAEKNPKILCGYLDEYRKQYRATVKEYKKRI